VHFAERDFPKEFIRKKNSSKSNNKLSSHKKK
jgi:hypothetical protein